MAAFRSRGLNPEAPAYIPLSYCRQTPLPALPVVRMHLFPFSSPPLPPLTFFPTALHPQPPLFTNSNPIHPPPPPSAAVEPPPAVAGVDSENESFRIGVPRRSSGAVRSSQRHQKEANSGARFNTNTHVFGNRIKQNNEFRNRNTSRARTSSRHSRYVERRRGSMMLKKYGVLPLLDCEEKTTVMIKNIPKLYNEELLLKFLDEHCLLENQKRNENSEEDHTVSAVDFMYLPIDFRTGCSRGFGFVNFTEPKAAWKFFTTCNGKRWDSKVCEIACAKIQGREALVKHFEKSRFFCESDGFLPVCFKPPRDGSGTELVEEIRIGRRIAPYTPNV